MTPSGKAGLSFVCCVGSIVTCYMTCCAVLCCVAIEQKQLVLKLEEALAAARPAAAADAAPTPSPSAPASSPGLAATAAAAAQRLPWPENQLPLAELLNLLFWLQQHAVRLQLAPGAAADLYLDPDLEVYAAVRVPMLALQSRPTLIAGETTQRQQGGWVWQCRALISQFSAGAAAMQAG